MTVVASSEEGLNYDGNMLWLNSCAHEIMVNTLCYSGLCDLRWQLSSFSSFSVVCVIIWTYVLQCREFLWKFFYPADYQPMTATELPQPGQRRMWKSFDFKMSMQHDVTLDILFTKDKVSLLCTSVTMCSLFLGRLFWVDLIKWVSNVRPYVCTSVCPQKVSSISMKFGK